MSDNTVASALCDICHATGEVETDATSPRGIATALLWAMRFAKEHPDIRNVSEHVILVPRTDQSDGGES